MTRRKIRDHNEAAELLEALETSGQSAADFCRARGLDGRSLNCWRINLQRDGAPPQRDGAPPQRDDGPALGGLRLVELAAARPEPAVYRIVVGGIEVEVDDHFREDTLARLLAVVAAC